MKERTGGAAERPILFSGAMVRATLDGRKTITRRVVKPQPMSDEGESLQWIDDPSSAGWDDELGSDPCFAHWMIMRPGKYQPAKIRCPYGAPGDRLWVRESHYAFGHWEKCDGKRARTRKGRQRWKFVPDSDEVRFDEPRAFRKGRHHKDPSTPAWHRRSSLFMPRWASRIVRPVISVRPERVQDITEEDAVREGMARGVIAEVFDLAAGKTKLGQCYYLIPNDNRCVETDWCHRCGTKEAKKRGYTLSPDTFERDGPAWCEKCGFALDGYSLTDYGMEREMFLDYDNPEDIPNYPVRGEGAVLMSMCLDHENHGRLAKIAFATLWNLINGPGAWERNDWVWRIEYGRLASTSAGGNL